jgi:hypothetical protein
MYPRLLSAGRAALYLVSVAGLAGVLTAATEPPLPVGAGPVWDSAKAWQVSSESRGRICLNGLWRFRSAAFPGPAPAFRDAFDTPGLDGWVLGEPGRGSCRLDADTEVKQTGTGALRLSVDIPPQTNFYHLARSVMLQADTAYTLTVAIRTELTSGYVALEVQDQRNRFDGPTPEIFLAQASDRTAGKTPWRRLSLVFRTRPGGSAHRLMVRYYGGDEAWKGTVWLDDLTITERSTGIPAAALPPPDDAWGFCKVPGNPKSSEMVTYWHSADPAKGKSGAMEYAWYEREAQIPAAWGGRRIVVNLERVSTRLRLYCNGEPAGEVGWFGGEVDVTGWAKPGSTVRLTALVRGLAADDVSDLVSERGLQSWQRQAGSCALGGDIWLDSGPALGPRLGRFLIHTRVSDLSIAVTAPLLELPPTGVPAGLTLVCEVRDSGRVVKEFAAPVAADNRPAFARASWPEAECWDIGKPRLYTLTVSLKRGQDTLDQALPETFGFREFEIRGRFFYLNGSRVNLRPCSYNVARLYTLSPDCLERWFDRIVAEGRNLVYTESVDSPNRNEALQPVLQAADAHGVLMAITPLQINPFWERLDDPAVRNAFAQHLRQRAERVWNHPSLVLYRLNMNFCGYAQDQNPLLLSGEVRPPADSVLGRKFAAAALSSQLLAEIDPTRRSYHHASGNAGDIYTLNNYLCWPEPQDLREWLSVWAERGVKPLMMVEFDLPYPGSFSLLDPSSWWSTEPLMTEYGAILLGERSYALEEDDYRDFTELAWNRGAQKWESAYGYYCSAVPAIVDECSAAYYATVLPAWRTWGLSGGINPWEYATARLKQRAAAPSNVGGMRVRPPDVPLPTDWETLQRPGFAPDRYVYDVRGNGHIQTYDIPGLPTEAEYLEPTLWGKAMPELLRPLYAYIAGPGDDWPEQDHAYYADETLRKSLVLLNDRRAAATYTVRWRVVLGDRLLSERSETAQVVEAAGQGRLVLQADLPELQGAADGEIQAEVSVAGEAIPVAPFAFQVHPRPARPALPDGWVLYDPKGRTSAALARLGLKLPALGGEVLPASAKVLLLGSEALSQEAWPKGFRDLPTRVAGGLQVLLFEQTPEALEKHFGLRAFSRGSRQVWVRDRSHAFLAGLSNRDLADWRGKTSLGPLDPAPASLDESQRWKRVWRCSQRGTVASTIVEKPHCGAFRPLLDGGFDLRYMMLWEVPEGQGRLVFCQMDVSDRLGQEPAADRLVGNLLAELAVWTPPPVSALCLAGAPDTIADLQALVPGAPANPALLAPTPGGVVLAGRGCAAWLTQQAPALRALLAAGGQVLAAGCTAEDAQALEEACGVRLALQEQTRGGTLLPDALPTALRGIGPAETHWRERRRVLTVSQVPLGGWRSPAGILACLPAGKGTLIWLAALPADFDPARRPDLVFTKVNTARLLTLILTNGGVRTPSAGWSAGLASAQPAADSLPTLYLDRRVPRDDPYAYMRW